MRCVNEYSHPAGPLDAYGHHEWPSVSTLETQILLFQGPRGSDDPIEILPQKNEGNGKGPQNMREKGNKWWKSRNLHPLCSNSPMVHNVCLPYLSIFCPTPFCFDFIRLPLFLLIEPRKTPSHLT